MPKERQLSDYAIFMKKQLPIYKKRNPDKSHKECFKAVADDWKKHQSYNESCQDYIQKAIPVIRKMHPEFTYVDLNKRAIENFEIMETLKDTLNINLNDKPVDLFPF